MTGPQAPARCPVEWCAITSEWHLASPGWLQVHRRHFGGNLVYVAIEAHGGDAPVIVLSAMSADPVFVELTPAGARMLAALVPEAYATALTEAADELDRITSGGTS